MRLSNALNPTFTEVMKSIRQENAVSRAENGEDGSPFSTILANRQTDCPYGYLAKDGIIEYNGVVFVCDPKTNSICLGDMSDPKQVLNISLPSGGNLKINVNNFGDISRAVGMFSPEDLNAIMRAISQYNHCTRKLNEIEQEEDEVMNVTQNDDEQYTGESTGETMNADEAFKMLKETMIEEHKLTPEKIKLEKDWRKMDDEQWDKLIEHIDKYIDDFKEELEHREEIQEEAAMKAMADAPADMRATAASKAMLSAVVNGIAGEEPDGDVSHLEKISWTYEMQTDDQSILAKAKMANEFAPDMISKSQEMALSGDTTVGISETENVKECASLDEDENKKKIWTITAFTQEGIICTECPAGGSSRELWRIDYENPEDAEKVWEFLARFDKDADLKFAGSQRFWEDFLAGSINNDQIKM